MPVIPFYVRALEALLAPKAAMDRAALQATIPMLGADIDKADGDD